MKKQLIEALDNLCTLNEQEAPLKDIDESVRKSRKLLEAIGRDSYDLTHWQTRTLTTSKSSEVGQILLTADKFIGLSGELADQLLREMTCGNLSGDAGYEDYIYEDENKVIHYTEAGQDLFEMCLSRIESVLEAYRIFNAESWLTDQIRERGRQLSLNNYSGYDDSPKIWTTFDTEDDCEEF